MTKATVGTKVEAYKSSCIGVMIDSTTYTGTITKVNKKSIWVHLEKAVVKHGHKETKEYAESKDVKYTFSKTLDDGKDFYTSEYRLYGCIRL